MRILHVIDSLGAGGPARSLLVFLKQSQISAADLSHTVVSLKTDAYPPLLFALRGLGVPILRAPAREDIDRHVAEADVVLIHFWNTPAIWAFLTAQIPVARHVLWSQILGSRPPQMLNPWLARRVAAVVLTSADSPLPPDLERNAAVVPGLSDFARLAGVRAEAHAGFNVDYIGTCNVGKIHPHFVEMMARADIPHMAVRICGGRPDATIANAISASPAQSRFRLCGFVEDIAAILRTSDVFGYPLAEHTYATSDISLQEAMFAGVPPVVFPHGGPARFVSNGKTGIVARSEDEFVAALEYLHRNPDVRHELGRNAADFARKAFAAEAHVARLIDAIRAAALRPRTHLFPEFRSPAVGDQGRVERFLVSQGWEPAEAVAAVGRWRRGDVGQLDRFIAGLSDEAFTVEGGVLHWRNANPHDAAFRLWAAIWLLRQGRTADARAEGRRALDLGAPADACGRVVELADDKIPDDRRAALRADLGLTSVSLSPAAR